MAHHRQAVGAHAKGEPGEFVRVVSGRFEHRRMDHPAPEQLEPVALVADMHLGRRLGEWEVVRDELGLGVCSEEFVGKMLEDPFEVTERDVGVDGEPFDLVEHRGVRGVERIAAIHPPRHHQIHRRLVLLHVAGLHRRGVRAEQNLLGLVAVLQIQRVHGEPGRVSLRKVECGEVVVLGLGLGAGRHRVSHGDEDVDDLIHHLLDDVDAPPVRCPAWQGNVDGI